MIRHTLILLALILPATVLARYQSREHGLIDLNWKFAMGDPENAEDPGFDDSQWRTLNLPHDWSIEGEFSQDAPTLGRGGYLPTGVGWYRKTIDLPEGIWEKKVWVQFDGVYQNSTVWVNGIEAGHRPFGYISFRYDISPCVQPGRNVIAVRVDNSNQPNTRWYSGSGIYRHVWLSIVDPLHIAHWGVCVTTPEASETFARVDVEVTMVNSAIADREAILRTTIRDANGVEVASDAHQVTIEVGHVIKSTRTLPVAEPELWSVDNPYLYTVYNELIVDDQLVDDQVTTFGIRHIAYDAMQGFLLNGERIKMNGVCLHHDGGPVGAAVPERVWELRLETLKAMGCNAVRTAHNPMAPEFLDLCDRMGFLVMDEIFDEWTHGKVEYGYNKYFDDWAQQDLRDFIRRDRNHPSVVMWSAGNEIGEQSVEGGHEILEPLLETFHHMDPTRPVTTGNDHIGADGRRAFDTFLNMLDIVGYNYMDRWHERRELYASIDKLQHPDWLIVGTESGSIRNRRGNYSLGDDPGKVRANYATGMLRAEQLWKFVTTHDYVIGDFMWTGIDYLGEARWPNKNASSGELDLAGFPKDGYYFYQSQWTDEPVLHLFPHWNWPGREGQFLPVLAYTNCDTVELFLNGKAIGMKTKEFPRQGTSGGWNSYDRPLVRGTTSDLHFTWDVPYSAGTLRAEGRKNGEMIIQEIHTTGAPVALRLEADRAAIRSDHRDVSHIRIEGVDAQGRVVPVADDVVTLEVSGAGQLIGFENGDPSDKDSPKGLTRRLYNGLALGIVQSNGKEGRIVVRAASPGLQRAAVEIAASADAATTYVFKDFVTE